METNLIDAPVMARDGQAGRVVRVAMDPRTRKITHVVVETSGLLGRLRVVPIEHTHLEPDGRLTLTMTRAEVEALPVFEETQFLPPESGWDYPMGYPPGGIVWPMSMGYVGGSTYPLLADAVVKENLPADDVTIAEGVAVECTDGHCGTVERVLVDDQEALVGFVIKRGFLFTHDVQAPLSWVDRVDDEAVHLKLSKEQLKDMEKYHS